jgi:hypothetical protein
MPNITYKFKPGKVDEEELEALIKLLTTSGKTLDMGRSKGKMVSHTSPYYY